MVFDFSIKQWRLLKTNFGMYYKENPKRSPQLGPLVQLGALVLVTERSNQEFYPTRN
jgi:hypothetical protein